MREKNPRLEARTFRWAQAAVLARELLTSRHDFIIARIPDDLNPRLFESREIGVRRACLIVRKGHPLTKLTTTPVERLVDFDWVFQPGGVTAQTNDSAY